LRNIGCWLYWYIEMKRFLIILLLTLSACGLDSKKLNMNGVESFYQNELDSETIDELSKVKIDTLEINYKIPYVVTITSFIPQISGEINDLVKNKINSNIKQYFEACQIESDSALYIRNFLNDVGVNSLSEYNKMKKQEEVEIEYYRDDFTNESFSIDYVSQNLLVLTVEKVVDPYMAKELVFYETLIYDLNDGSKLSFEDFFSIDPKSLIEKIFKDGYMDEVDNIVPFKSDYGMECLSYYNYFIDNLSKESDCLNNFYFVQNKNDIDIRFNMGCWDNRLSDIGISLNKLLPYIKYHEFKSRYNLWGKNINSLKGKEFPVNANKLKFDDHLITNPGGGYLLSKDSNFPNTNYGISYCYSNVSVFYVFFKYDSVKLKKNATVLDILEIKRTDITGNKNITEYCETQKGADTEIFALVVDDKNNPEFYTEIVKAWRANRKTEKIEVIDNKKVKKCSNESYGL